jgi:hypothetical protein
MKLRSASRVSAATLFASLLAASIAAAQAVSTASIAGRVEDESGGALPGVTVTATQTATGLVRTGVTDDMGGYTLPSLPIGPYRLEFSLDGFRTFVQTGIVLEVNASPTINAKMALGGLTETVQVEAAASLIETRSPGIGQVVDNQRVVELPLNGRQTLDLVMLTGMAAPSGTLGGARGTSASTTISVAGGQANGMSYILDGGNHNDPFNNAAMPFPFPEALQEFKVETSALPAQYGHHSAAAVNAVTKSGTNRVAGTAFEFLRDDVLNARDPFAPLGPDGKRRRDGLNRNQFGGVIGGPIATDRMFYFVGYQQTRIRRTPSSNFEFVPTPAMMAGDFTAFASPACNAGRQITLRAPFVNNRVDPALFSPASRTLVSQLPTPVDECGRLYFDRREESDEHIVVGRVDLTMGNDHSMFGRLQVTRFDSPGNYDGRTFMSYSSSIFKNRSYSFVYGDTLIFGNNVVNGLRVTLNRGDYARDYIRLIDYTDLGIKATPVVPDYLRLSVTGGFSMMGGGALPGETPTWTYQVADDLSVVRSNHQLGVGINYIHTRYDSISNLAATGNITFTGQVTGAGLADFVLGRAASFSQGSTSGLSLRQHYFGAYAQDSWRVNPNLTINAGVRWEPNFPAYAADSEITAFSRERFDRGIRSTRFVNAPGGLLFPGDEGFPGDSIAENNLWQFAPRLAAVWDPNGEGRQSLRTSYGRFFDVPHMQSYAALPQTAPWGNTINVTNLPLGWDDPYVAYPGGNPIPFVLSPEMRFPAFANYTTYAFDLKPTNMDQWNVSYQVQIGGDWMASANYLGSITRNIWTTDQINPAIYVPGASTVGNTNARRVLNLQNPAEGAYYASIQQVTDDGTANYNGLLLSVQRRRAAGLTVQGNYTISRCISDRANLEPGVAGAPYTIPGDREADRGRCPNSPDHNANLSAVYAIPSAGDGALRALTEDWQVSAIFSARSGQYLTVTSGVDSALTGQPNQRANQVLSDPYMPDRSFLQWLNPDAFAAPAQGTYGTMPIDAFLGPGRWNVDLAITRALRMGGEKQVQLRFEAFNLFNHTNLSNPVTTLNSPNFGQITSASTEPRILQLAIKYQF